MSEITEAAQIDMMTDILREPCTVRLYVNDPGTQPTASDFVEPTGGGYAPKPMRLQSWDLSNAPQEAVYPKQTWTFTGPAGIVVGHYVTRNSDGKLRWYDPLSGGPQRIVNDGDQISVTPTFSLGQDDEADEQAEEAREVE